VTGALVAVLLAIAGVRPQPVPIGVGARYHPHPGAHVAPGLRCSRESTPRYGVHLELFARGRVVVVPAGIGIAPPLRRQGAYVRGGRCSLPVRTREPTGLLEVAPGSQLMLGQLFRVWGRRIDPGARAYVNGRRWRGRPRAIPLSRHSEIVLEVGRYVRPHPFYLFPKGF
jgi:hypothetical protein